MEEKKLTEVASITSRRTRSSLKARSPKSASVTLDETKSCEGVVNLQWNIIVEGFGVLDWNSRVIQVL